MRGGQFAIGLQGAEQAVLRELTHLQYIFDGWAFTAQLRSLGAAGDGQHFEVQIVGQTLVQAQFFSAKVSASLKAGEVEKTEIDRLLHFIGVGAGKQYPGNMGLDDLESLYWMRVEGRVLQGSDQGLAHRRSFRVGEIQGSHYGRKSARRKPRSAPVEDE
ncbi:hypothetical protein D3C73_1331280 [compost metagenome]